MQFLRSKKLKHIVNNDFSRFKIILFIFCFFIVGCSAGATPNVQKQYGADSGYFIALRKLEQNEEKEARTYLLKTAKKGSFYCARKSAQLLTELGNHADRKKACDFLIGKFSDSDSKLIAAKEYFYLNEISKVISITSNIDLSSENNELIKLRIESLYKNHDAAFESEAIRWFYGRPISDFHYQFYRDIYVPLYGPKEDASEIEEEIDPVFYSVNYRILIYRRDYKQAFEHLPLLLKYLRNQKVTLTPQLASDIGKTYFYGSADYLKNAQEMYSLAADFKETCAEFYFLFYAGRLFDKGELYRRKSEECYEKAIRSTEDATQIDNALWYLLTSKLSYGIDSIVENLDTYAAKWTDKEYFDDFFESLLSSLLISGKWDSLYTVYKKIDGKASDESVARYAYIYGRLLQEGYAKVPAGVDKNERIKNAFYHACKSGTSVYYKLMASYHLNFTEEEILELLKEKITNKQVEADPAAEILLKGYAAFGFPERIYPEYDRNKISLETSMFLSEFLRKCAQKDEAYYAQALRIASKSANINSEGISLEDLKLVYPTNFEDKIIEYSKKFEMNPGVMFALIRSESFFDPTIISSAGAVGLTQLMEFTAGDVARKLKISEYDLNDAETNIQFGTYYLSELVRRCNDSLLIAFFSYNAGISRVRRWQQTSLTEFGKKKNMPGDLFLETIPFSETREYGRKLVSASLIYNLLYNFDNSPSFATTVEKLVY